MTRQIEFLLFDDVELLDFAGPYEVFSAANRMADRQLFQVSTVSQHSPIVTVANGISVNTDYRLDDAPPGQMLLVPGGVGARTLLDDQEIVAWIARRAAAAEFVFSICTGALLLAKAGLLDGLSATTHHSRIELLRELAPTAVVTSDERVVDNGTLILSAGISAGIDLTFHAVARLAGLELALETARYMEYPWSGPKDCDI